VILLRHVLATQNANGGWQDGVERVSPALNRESSISEIDMCALSERMNTCIGASGAVNPDALAADLLERVFQFVLNSLAMGLALPAGEGRAVVSNG
jgi:hypothetical protein